MNMRKGRMNLFRFSIAMTLVAACGGGDGRGHNGTNNSETNNGATNNGATNNGTTNNGTTNNGTTNNGTTNNGATNNGTTNNGTTNHVPMGAVTFDAPTETEVYTNGTLDLAVEADGEASDIELILDDTETLTTFTDELTFAWDTTTVPEGEYGLGLRYTVGGAQEVSDDTRVVHVDRTAPTLVDSTPAAGSANSRLDVPITLLFDEPLAPGTVDTTTVFLAFGGGQSVDHTVALSADGLTITVDFDRAAVPTPFHATVATNGVSDRAGNAVSDTLEFVVPAWVSEEIPHALYHPSHVSLDGSEYVIGVKEGAKDELQTYKRDSAGNWTMVDSEPVDVIYDVAVDVEGDIAYIAVLRTLLAGTTAQLFELDPATDTLTVAESVTVDGFSNTSGEIALDMRNLIAGLQGAIAVVADKQVQVFTFFDGALALNTPNTFPSADAAYANARTGSLSVHMGLVGRPEVIFAKCNLDVTPCPITSILRVAKGSNTWSVKGNAASTPNSASASQCDEFVNFEVSYVSGDPYMLFAYSAPCSAPKSVVRNYDGESGSWVNIVPGNIREMMPNPDDATYSVHLALGAQDQVHALLASEERLELARFGTDTIAFLPAVAAGLATAANSPLQSIRTPRLFMSDTDSPLVLFRYGLTTQVWRLNE